MRDAWPPARYLYELAHHEASERTDRRVARLLSGARLPADKRLDTLEFARISGAARYQIRDLCQGAFVDQATNVCLFGPPGVSKSHVMAAIGRELAIQAVPVLFIRVQTMVERLLAAKHHLQL